MGGVWCQTWFATTALLWLKRWDDGWRMVSGAVCYHCLRSLLPLPYYGWKDEWVGGVWCQTQSATTALLWLKRWVGGWRMVSVRHSLLPQPYYGWKDEWMGGVWCQAQSATTALLWLKRLVGGWRMVSDIVCYHSLIMAEKMNGWVAYGVRHSLLPLPYYGWKDEWVGGIWCQTQSATTDLLWLKRWVGGWRMVLDTVCFHYLIMAEKMSGWVVYGVRRSLLPLTYYGWKDEWVGGVWCQTQSATTDLLWLKSWVGGWCMVSDAVCYHCLIMAEKMSGWVGYGVRHSLLPQPYYGWKDEWMGGVWCQAQSATTALLWLKRLVGGWRMVSDIVCYHSLIMAEKMNGWVAYGVRHSLLPLTYYGWKGEWMGGVWCQTWFATTALLWLKRWVDGWRMVSDTVCYHCLIMAEKMSGWVAYGVRHSLLPLTYYGWKDEWVGGVWCQTQSASTTLLWLKRWVGGWCMVSDTVCYHCLIMAEKMSGWVAYGVRHSLLPLTY